MQFNHKIKSHWELAERCGLMCDNQNFEKAYEYITEALKIKEDCPLSWWYLACTLEGLEEFNEAITVWEHIISFDTIHINFEENPCWESVEFKESLIIDSYYRVACTFLLIGEIENSKKRFEQFLDRKTTANDNGIKSIYSFNDALRKYNLIK